MKKIKLTLNAFNIFKLSVIIKSINNIKLYFTSSKNLKSGVIIPQNQMFYFIIILLRIIDFVIHNI